MHFGWERVLTYTMNSMRVLPSVATRFYLYDHFCLEIAASVITEQKFSLKVKTCHDTWTSRKSAEKIWSFQVKPTRTKVVKTLVTLDLHPLRGDHLPALPSPPLGPENYHILLLLPYTLRFYVTHSGNPARIDIKNACNKYAKVIVCRNAFSRRTPARGHCRYEEK